MSKLRNRHFIMKIYHGNEIFRRILNKTKEDRVRDILTRLELGVDEIKNDIQKSRLR
jgi:hypothetical protein